MREIEKRREREDDHLTDVLSIVIFGLCLLLFIINKIPLALTAIMGLAAMVVLNVCSYDEAFAFFGSEAVILICCMMVVGKASFQTGLAQSIGFKVLSLARGNERMLAVVGTAITGVMSAFLSNIATLSIMIYMVNGNCEANPKIKARNLIMPIAMGAVLGGMATLIGSTPQLTAQGLLESYLGDGNGFDFFTFSIPGALIILATVLYVAFIGYPLGKRLWGNRESTEDLSEAGKTYAEGEMHPEKKGVMAVIFILMLLMFFGMSVIQRFIPQFDLAIVAIISASACILSGCIRFGDALKSIGWNLVIWLASSLGMAGAVNSSGGGELIAGLFTGILNQNTPPMLIFTAFVSVTVLLTHFLSNSTAVTIVLPIALSILPDMGYSVYPFAVGITMGSAIAIATPVANTTIAMSMVAGYKFSDYWKYGGPLVIISTLIVILVVPILYPMV